MLDLVLDAIRYVLQGRRCQQAFEQNGFAADLHLISVFVRHQCGPEALPPLPIACPTAEQLRTCWPRNRPFHAELVLFGIPASGPPVAALMDAEASVPAIVPLLGLPGRSQPLLLHALGMDAPDGPAPLGGAPAGDVAAPVSVDSDSPALVVPEEAASWRPIRRLTSKTSFEMQ